MKITSRAGLKLSLTSLDNEFTQPASKGNSLTLSYSLINP